MTYLIFITALAVLLATILTTADLFWGIRNMTRILDISPLSEEKQPRISIIVPACNEEKNIRKAILTQLKQNYANFEVIAIDDRSTDATGAYLDRLQSEYRSLKVHHISHLPEGWMGKAHALQKGAEIADGEYLLFTDADILMEESTLARAACHMCTKQLDHLALVFRNISPGWLLNSLILESGAALIQLFRPWRVKKPHSGNFIGVGAFNMVKRSTYLALNGHESIKMHPVDDIMLGKIIKRNGYRQDCLLGTDMVVVPWYESVRAMIDGLMKNVLAIINYRFLLLIPLLFGMVLLNILPFWGLLLAEGYSRFICAATVIIKLVSNYYGTRLIHVSPWCAVGTLITPYISVYIVLRAAWLNYSEGGIYWRGTHYSIEKLRTNEPILP